MSLSKRMFDEMQREELGLEPRYGEEVEPYRYSEDVYQQPWPSQNGLRTDG